MNKVTLRATRMLVVLLISCFLLSGTVFAQSNEGQEETGGMETQLVEGYAGTEEADEDENNNSGEGGSGENTSESAGASGDGTNDNEITTNVGITAHDIFYDDTTNRQFIIVEDKDGNVFYLIIDYDVPVDEAQEQYKTYFLNPVDTEDLASLAETNEAEGKEEEVIVPVCTCNEKCKTGEVDTTCEICVDNYFACAGEEVVEETEEAEEAEEEEEEKSTGMGSMMVVLVVVIATVIGVVVYKKVIKGGPGKKVSSESYEDELEGLEEYTDESDDAHKEQGSLHNEDLEIEYMDLNEEDE